ncbi:hypothetical protein ACLMJK_009291 [Lecanora helva]
MSEYRFPELELDEIERLIYSGENPVNTLGWSQADNEDGPGLYAPIPAPGSNIEGFDNGNTDGDAPADQSIYNLETQTVRNVSQGDAESPVYAENTFDINGVPQYPPYHGENGQELPFGLSEPPAGQVPIPNDPGEDRFQPLANQDQPSIDWSGVEDHYGLISPECGEEEEAEFDDSEDQIDYGDFVIQEFQGRTNLEKAGTTRETEDGLDWYNPRTGEWIPAIAHHNIRKELLEQIKAQYPNQSYEHPDPRGAGPHDVTAFHPEYRIWGSVFDDRPQILFRFDPPSENVRLRKPDPMMHEGMIVLNHQNNPVLNWNIPVTLSSKTSGSLMEAWKRMFPGLGQEDMRARMVRYTFEVTNGQRQRVALPDKNTTVNMPMQRFRDRAGLIAWSTRPGSNTNREAIIGVMQSAENFDPTITNSTEDFGRDLTIHEQAQVKAINKAKYRNKFKTQTKRDKGKHRMPNNNDENTPELNRGTVELSHKRVRMDDEYGDTTLLESDLEEASDQLDQDRPRRKRARTSSAETNQRGTGNIKTEHQDRGTNLSQGPVNLVQQLQATKRKQKQQRSTTQSRLITSGMSESQTRDPENDGAEINESIGDLGTANPRTPDRGSISGTAPNTGSTLGGSTLVNSSDPLEDSLSSEDDEVILFQSQPSSGSDDESKAQSRPSLESDDGADMQIQRSSEIDDDAEVQSRSSSGNDDQGNMRGHRRTREEFEDESGGSDDEDEQPPRRRQRVESSGSQGTEFLQEDMPSDEIDSEMEIPWNDITAPAPDRRIVPPQTKAECREISLALIKTRESFFEWTGFRAPTTDPTASYISQWMHILDEFESFDWSHEPDGEPPYLLQLPEFHASWEECPVHLRNEMYYEPWTRGVRAPRDVNGVLIDMPGEYLEGIAMMDKRHRRLTLNDAAMALGRELGYHGEAEEEDGYEIEDEGGKADGEEGRETGGEASGGAGGQTGGDVGGEASGEADGEADGEVRREEGREDDQEDDENGNEGGGEEDDL